MYMCVFLFGVNLNNTFEICNVFFQGTAMLPVVVVHGGAGHIPKERSDLSTSGVCSAVRSAYALLQGGGSSMDAVVEAVLLLENNPSFNAGIVKMRWPPKTSSCYAGFLKIYLCSKKLCSGHFQLWILW